MYQAANIARMGALLVGVLGMSGVASAQETVPSGVIVRITGIGREDAFFKQRKDIVGTVCGVEDPGLEPQSKKWYGGAMTCGDAGNYYFYQVSVEVGDFGYDYEALTGHAPGAAVVTDSPWQVGARVQVTDVSAEDAHIDERSEIVGQTCTVSGAALEASGDPWFSGQLKCDNGMDVYFYQVAVGAPGAAPTTSGAVAPSIASPVAVPSTTPTVAADYPAGKMVKVVDIAPADALYPTRAALIGHTCSVVESALAPINDGYYAGRLFCDDGKSYQVFMAKLSAP
ncbi:MAG: hypothetical protein Q8P41_21965 [Pseudomonadota bacterium]|nr:hypothetical protein [Pseudomonadota bacterium]